GRIFLPTSKDVGLQSVFLDEQQHNAEAREILMFSVHNHNFIPLWVLRNKNNLRSLFLDVCKVDDDFRRLH
ncbi:MAG: hypothetical protein OXI63_02285, partial [Candidatus Poribacteria bacterium]|nr:hypothetical protein [Candidatus Poribacteria bacterium]